VKCPTQAKTGLEWATAADSVKTAIYRQQSRFRTVDACGVFDLSRAIPVGSIVRAHGPPARRDIAFFLSSSFLD
jgi:hypothetical protein